MAPKLKLWNGRGGMLDTLLPNAARAFNHATHAYVAAYSVADAVALITEALGRAPRGCASEISKYWSAGAWGTSMADVVPQRGIWMSEGGHAIPVHVWPPEPPRASVPFTFEAPAYPCMDGSEVGVWTDSLGVFMELEKPGCGLSERFPPGVPPFHLVPGRCYRVTIEELP